MKKLWQKLINILSDVKYFLILLVIITVSSVVGTVLPQGNNYYQSPLFSALLILLAINLFACTLKRLKLKLSVYTVGTHILHIGLLIVLIGGILTNTLGWKTDATIYEGETYTLHKKPHFSIKLHDFEVQRTKKNEIKAFISDLSIIDNGKEVLRRKIEVNKPLKYKKTYMYQSSYGRSWDKVNYVDMSVYKPGFKDIVLGHVRLPFNEKVKVEHIKRTLKVSKFLADFRLDVASGQAFSGSRNHNQDHSRDGNEFPHWIALNTREKQ